MTWCARSTAKRLYSRAQGKRRSRATLGHLGGSRRPSSSSGVTAAVSRGQIGPSYASTSSFPSIPKGKMEMWGIKRASACWSRCGGNSRRIGTGEREASASSIPHISFHSGFGRPPTVVQVISFAEFQSVGHFDHEGVGGLIRPRQTAVVT